MCLFNKTKWFLSCALMNWIWLYWNVSFKLLANWRFPIFTIFTWLELSIVPILCKTLYQFSFEDDRIMKDFYLIFSHHLMWMTPPPKMAARWGNNRYVKNINTFCHVKFRLGLPCLQPKWCRCSPGFRDEKVIIFVTWMQNLNIICLRCRQEMI
jgi:hypothetical protein